jgi:hypothetical protein
MAKSLAKKKTAAAFTAGDDESARGRLLNAATHLFCKNGINATGIDRGCDRRQLLTGKAGNLVRNGRCGILSCDPRQSQ